MHNPRTLDPQPGNLRVREPKYGAGSMPPLKQLCRLSDAAEGGRREARGGRRYIYLGTVAFDVKSSDAQEDVVPCLMSCIQ